MLIRLGPPPNSLTDAELATGAWRRLAQWPLWSLQLLSLPVGGIVAFLCFAAWAVLTPPFDVSFAPTHQIAGALFLVVLAGLLLQLSAYPGRGFTKASVLGFWPSRMTPYTACRVALGRDQLIVCLLLPLVGLSVVPLLIASVLHISPGWLVFTSCAAAAIFGINLLMAVSVLRLPHGSVVAGQGLRMFWKPPT